MAASVACALAALSCLAGCKQIPVSELSQYRAAFAEAQAASQDVLIDFAQAIENAEEADSDGDASAPTRSDAHVFSNNLDEIGSEEISDIEMRRLALLAIDRYNNALATLAEGKSIESVQTATNGFVQTVGDLVQAGGSVFPGLGALASLAETVATQAEKARLRAEFERAVREGAPIVEEILLELIADRTDHLTLRSNEATLRQVAITGRIADRVRTLRAIAAERTAPAAGDPDPLADLQEQLDAALSGTGLYEDFALAYGASGDAISEIDRAMASEVIKQLATDAGAYRSNIQQHDSLRSALRHYGVLLLRTQSALADLETALDRPVDFEASANELLQLAFSIRRDIEAVKAARDASAN